MHPELLLKFLLALQPARDGTQQQLDSFIVCVSTTRPVEIESPAALAVVCWLQLGWQPSDRVQTVQQTTRVSGNCIPLLHVTHWM